ncbi:MAG TPA: RDD family protein [Saprospiraceae bacterium]|nr:RDD family protein [Saprospiraceae bacterium]QLH28872.1 MAG: RDD family protein [Candidatus Parvibacillus calidus]HRN34667.1 RDD family protein [Saprospiraceae bacterium]HRP85283.1 RDD family protein [Saprospiraceae bacterium]
MEYITINTTQNVNINFPLAGTGSRIAAFLIDLVIKYVYIIIVIQLLSHSDLEFSIDQWSASAIYIICLSPIFFYSLVWEYFNNGRTPGKMVVKIRVAKIDGYQADFIDIFTRWAMRMIDIQLGFGLIGLITMTRNNKNQRLGDIAAGTSVISQAKTFKFEQTIFEELHKNYTPTYPDVIKLSDNDIRIIKENLEKSRKFDDLSLILRLKYKVEDILGIKSSEDPYIFINKVITDYNYYTQESD